MPFTLTPATSKSWLLHTKGEHVDGPRGVTAVETIGAARDPAVGDVRRDLWTSMANIGSFVVAGVEPRVRVGTGSWMAGLTGETAASTGRLSVVGSESLPP